ncbi:MAG: hypothetical protein JXR60_01730 [Bacteroidales bacterium]|nr:hypothetical protein [Bacteroidales bacterium]
MAQGTHTSPYSFLGIGDINDDGLSMNRSLGGLGIGINSSYGLNGLNPAGISQMDTMSFTFEFGASGIYKYTQTSTSSEGKFNGNIDYLAIGFPTTKWLKTSFGMMPYSKVGYNLIENVDVYDGSEYLFTIQRKNSGEGGINNLFLNNAITVYKNFTIGIQLQYLFGHIQKTLEDTPAETNNSVAEYTEERHLVINDFNYSFGLQYHQPIKNKTGFTIGGVFGLDNKIKTQNQIYQKSESSNIEIVLNDNRTTEEITAPMFYGFGLSVFTESWLIGADFKTTLWSQSSLSSAEYPLNNSINAVIGAEYIPRPRTANNYIQRMRYRLSARYQNSYISINDKSLTDLGITFGVGLPMKRSKSTINIGIDVGQIGVIDNTVLSQYYARFRLDISLHDVWFVKRKYD